MRAVTGTILATKPCSVAKAARILELFAADAGSDVLSSDAATYLHTAIEAADELNLFRRDLRRRQLQEGGGGSEIKRTHRPAPVNEEGRWEPKVLEEEFGRWEPKVVEEEYGRWEPKVEEENEEEYGMAAGEKKNSGKMKGSTEEKQDMAAVNGDLQSPASEKRRKKKKEKHAKEDDETGDGIGAQSRKALDDAFRAFVSGEGISSEKKAKKEKHIKQEEEVMRVKEVEQEMVHAGVAENGLASEEKKSKKRKHTEEEEVKKEVADGDLGSDKKRKKKRGRDGDNGNDTELVEHKQKKQRK